jgi:hypothetical protein
MNLHQCIETSTTYRGALHDIGGNIETLEECVLNPDQKFPRLSLGKASCLWEENITMDVRNVQCGLKPLAQNRI